MAEQLKANDAVHWYMNEKTSRIVAESGIPTDRYHLGKIMLQSLKDAPDFLMQIDGDTDEKQTSGEALERSIRCAIAMKNWGLKRGDVIVLMAPNHIDLAMPFYAAFYLGVIVAGVDRFLGVQELIGTFNVDKPRLVFCQSSKASEVQLALNELDLDTKIITFDKGDYLVSFSDFLEKYSDDSNVDDFRPEDFDAEDTIALLIATSGTTGLPKSAAVTHKNLAITGPYLMCRYLEFPTPTKMVLVGSALQWLTALMNFILSPILQYTRLQSSGLATVEHMHYLINTYKPTFTILSPTLMTKLIQPDVRDNCDFTCFDLIMLGGSAVPLELIEAIKKIAPETLVLNTFGMSELTSVGFLGESFSPPASCGRAVGCFRYRLIDNETEQDILEPNVAGELWMKGPGIFKEYYDNPEATAQTFAEDRWFKTGDNFYRDENWNYYFVERIKLLLKYNNNQISPVEIESVIRKHSGVLDAAVTSVPDYACGDLPVACVVRNPGSIVTAQEIKFLVKETLSDAKQLRGGVIFLPEIPMTASTKVHRRKLKEIALSMKRE